MGKHGAQMRQAESYNMTRILVWTRESGEGSPNSQEHMAALCSASPDTEHQILSEL